MPHSRRLGGLNLYNQLLSGGAAVATKNSVANISESKSAADNLTALNSLLSSYDYIVIPPGTYPFNMITITGQGQTIVGCGSGAESGAGEGTSIQGQSGQAAVLKLGDGGSTSTFDNRIQGLNLTGSSTKGCHFDSAHRVHMEDISLDDLTATDGFVFDSAFSNYLANLRTAGGAITQYGFACNTDFNANVCDLWVTSNANQTENIRVNGGQNSVFNSPTCQGGDIGFHARAGGHCVNGLYTENTLSALTMGHAYDSLASGWTFNCGQFGGPYASHDENAARIANIFLYYAHAVTFNSPNFSGVDLTHTEMYRLHFLGGGGSGAKALARVHPDGNIHSIEVIRPGTGYTSAPTVSLGGTGSGATATATLSGSTVGSVSVTSGGQRLWPRHSRHIMPCGCFV